MLPPLTARQSGPDPRVLDWLAGQAEDCRVRASRRRDRGLLRRARAAGLVDDEGRLTERGRDLLAGYRLALATGAGTDHYAAIFQTAAVSLWHLGLGDLPRTLATLGRKAGARLGDEAARHVSVLDVNATTVRLFRAPSRAALLAHPERVLTPETRAILGQALVAFAQGTTTFDSEVVCRTYRGRRLDLFLQIALAAGEPDPRTAVVSLVDISRHKQTEQRLAYLAQHDELTGLPNRMLLWDRLQTSIRRSDRQRRRFALIYLDLDGFKAVNDRFGHAMGDALLRQTGARLERCARASDTVARIGGDEFVFVMEGMNRVGDAVTVAEKIASRLSQPFQLGGVRVRVTPSMGIAIYPDSAGDAGALLHNADSAMYRAKRNGAAFHLFTPALN